MTWSAIIYGLNLKAADLKLKMYQLLNLFLLVIVEAFMQLSIRIKFSLYFYFGCGDEFGVLSRDIWETKVELA